MIRINPHNTADGYCWCSVATRFRWHWQHGAFSGIVNACSRDHARKAINRELAVLGFESPFIAEQEFVMVAWCYSDSARAIEYEHCAALAV